MAELFEIFICNNACKEKVLVTRRGLLKTTCFILHQIKACCFERVRFNARSLPVAKQKHAYIPRSPVQPGTNVLETQLSTIDGQGHHDH